MTKTSKSLEVAVGSGLVPVGRLVFEADGQRQASMFRYDARWLDNPDRFAISPHLPLGEASFTASGSRENRRAALPYAIADAAPDGWGRGLVGKSLGRPATELEYLLLADDLTRQGALRFIDESGEPQSQAQPAIPRLNDLEDLRELARVYENDPAAAPDIAGRLMGFVGSLGGARPKANLDDNGRVEAISALARLLEVIENRWRSLLLSCGLSEKQAKAYALAFDHEETEVARKLAGQNTK